TAVGLGDIEQSSGLNQPLDAEIKILSPGDLAEYEVIASIASQNAFDKSGIDKPFFLNKIKFKTIKNSKGELVIKLTTHDAVKEPFLNFLIELNTPAQQFYREYTLLLDPPIFEEVTASTIEQTVSQGKQQTNTPEPSYSNQPKNAESQAPQSSYGNEETRSQSYDGNQYGPVSSTDTLWSIASKVRPSNNVSIHQTLVAIYRANPDAFSNGNINNLLRGKVLDIPSESTIQNVPQRAALQDVVMQNRQWRSGGARNIVDSTSYDSSSAGDGNRGARLSLATASSDGNASGYGADTDEIEGLKNELVKTQEESATLQAENDELRARLAEILAKAENVGEASGLGVDVEDAELAVLANNENLDNEIDETSDLDSDENSSAGLSDTSESQNNAQSLDTTADQNSANDSQPETKVEQKAKVPFQVTKPKEKSFLDSIMDSGELLWGGIAAVVVIILLVVFWRMKKRMEDDSFQDDLVASTGAGSMDTTEAFELPDVGDDMLVELDMDDEDGLNQNEGEAFDPLGEADIYIAYGKIDQAEALLLDAIEDNPIRSDYKVKLMECYAESDNKEGFERLSLEVQDAVDADEWADQIDQMKSKAWGEDLTDDQDEDEFDLPSTEDIFGDDDEEDFDIDLSEESSVESTAELDDEFGLNFKEDEDNDDQDSHEIEDLDDLDLEDLESLDASDIDSNIGADDDALDDLDDLDLDELDEFDADEISSEVSDDQNDDSLEDEFSLDLADDVDLNDGLTEQDIKEGDEELSIDIDDDGDISLDIDDDFDFAEDGDESIDFGETLSDEIATKLDLARAYVDMGDLDGAKEILTEVVADGTEQQKQEAQSLIDQC
ncbi:MAG: FimV/HubP family polar landmark protein, partial [Kangiellaceae bacterium]